MVGTTYSRVSHFINEYQKNRIHPLQPRLARAPGALFTFAHQE
jgi:hypothetical protein